MRSFALLRNTCDSTMTSSTTFFSVVSVKWSVVEMSRAILMKLTNLEVGKLQFQLLDRLQILGFVRRKQSQGIPNHRYDLCERSPERCRVLELLLRFLYHLCRWSRSLSEVVIESLLQWWGQIVTVASDVSTGKLVLKHHGLLFSLNWKEVGAALGLNLEQLKTFSTTTVIQLE